MNLNMPADKSDFKNTNYTHTHTWHTSFRKFKSFQWLSLDMKENFLEHT